jgi:hypothetical protein
MKGIVRSRVVAQSLAEYSLTIGLIAIISLAALMLLGKNINLLWAGLGNSLSEQDATSSVATATPVSGGSSGGTTPSDVKTVSFSMDAETGQLQMTNLENGGGGKITTSSQGTDLAALALLRLSNTATANDGEPADAETIGLIRQLAELGQKMAEQQASLKLPPSADRKSAAYKEFYYSGLVGTADSFSQIYDKLNAQIGSQPKYSNLLKQVNDYTGIASQSTWMNYMKNYGSNEANIALSVRGTNITTKELTTPFDPADIQAAMAKMAPLAENH